MRRVFACAIALSLVVLCESASAQTSRPTLKVLFIGNSYTHVNNLGDIVAGVAAAMKDGPQVIPTLATQNGVGLDWHLKNGRAVSLLERGGWDYVVLQDQSLLDGDVVNGHPVVGDPARFYSSVREWVQRIRAVHGTPILFMTWARRAPIRDRVSTLEKLASAYNSIGMELGVKVAPVGLAWAEAQRRLFTLDLHIWDDSHPTQAGSYLSAMVLYSTITGRKPLGAPPLIAGHPTYTVGDEVNLDSSIRVPLVDLREATAAELARVAWFVVSRRQD